MPDSARRVARWWEDIYSNDEEAHYIIGAITPTFHWQADASIA